MAEKEVTLNKIYDLLLDNRKEISGLRQELADTKAELKQEIADVKAELKQDIADVRQEIADVKAELKQDIADVRQEIADVKAELKTSVVDLRNEFKVMDARRNATFIEFLDSLYTTGKEAIFDNTKRIVKLEDAIKELRKEQNDALVASVG